MAKVRLDHLTDEELEDLLKYSDDAYRKLHKALSVIVDAENSLDEVREILGDHKFLGGGLLPEGKSIKAVMDLIEELEKFMEDVGYVYRFVRGK
jgi:hypothetical protein